MRRAVVSLIALAACGRVSFDARDDAASDGPVSACVVSDIAIGRDHTCMIDRGEVWCWGRNASGKAQPASGMGYMLAPSRVTLPGAPVQVAAGRVFSCARLDTGDVYCWGDNASGALGIGSTAPQSAPVRVDLGGATAIDLAAGTYQACVRRASDHGVMCWGQNDFFAAGDPSGMPVLTPRLVPGTVGAQQLGIGHKHACVVGATGQALCWGQNDAGQLGDTTGPRATAAVAPNAGVVAQLASGGRDTCAIDPSGALRCWGKNTDGQLGSVASAGANPDPDPVVLTDVVQVQAGASGNCALLRDRTVRCWGEIPPGDGTLSVGSAPRAASLTNIAKVAAGYYNGCAIDVNGRPSCWGVNAQGELGRGMRSIAPAPVLVPLAATQVFVASETACAIVSGDDVRCWGENGAGQLATGDRNGHLEPTPIAHGITGLVGFSLGLNHACAWNVTTLRCWGLNDAGQAAGNGINLFQTTATTIVGIAAPSQVVTGALHTCAIDGAATRCWGYNADGQLGDNTRNASPTPVAVSGLSNATALAAGNLYTCAIAAGNLYCWGHGGNGQLGDGMTIDRLAPIQVGLTNVTDVAAGRSHTCAVSNNSVYCWGTGSGGQLGQGDRVDRPSPTLVPLPAAPLDISVSFTGTCALLVDSTTYCWGDNQNGQLGSGSFTGSLVPLHIVGLDGASSLAASQHGGCAVRGTQLSCWGTVDLLANGDYSTALPAPPLGCE